MLLKMLLLHLRKRRLMPITNYNLYTVNISIIFSIKIYTYVSRDEAMFLSKTSIILIFDDLKFYMHHN